MSEKESPIFSKTYDLITWLMQTLNGFPKEQRFRLAQQIENTLFTFHAGLLAAARFKEKEKLLLEADLELEKLRLYLRLAQDMRCLSFKQYEHVSRMVNEVGKLLGGWMKTARASTAAREGW